MKMMKKSVLLLLMGSFISVGANASIYVGAKGGQLKIDEETLGISYYDFDEPLIYGAYAGYGLDYNFAVELEYLRSQETELKYAGSSSILNGVDANVTTQTVGAYGTYRYYLPNTGFYGKGKMGYAYTKGDTEVNAPKGVNTETGSGDAKDETSFAVGVGVGYEPIQNIGVEAEYSKLSSDTGAMTIGVHMKF